MSIFAAKTALSSAEDDQYLTVTAGTVTVWWRGSLSPAAHFSDESECCESLQAFVEVKITEHNDIEICKRISHRHCFLGGEVGKGVDQSASQILTSNVRNQNRTEINLHLESWHRMYGTRIVQKYKKTHWEELGLFILWRVKNKVKSGSDRNIKS